MLILSSVFVGKPQGQVALLDSPQGKRVVPYYDRAQIDADPSLFKPLVWVEDVVEAFFLQIQGSGLIELADATSRASAGATRMRVGYADQNGHPFRGIGCILADRGEMKLE